MKEVAILAEIIPSDSLYPLVIFNKTPSYLSAFADEASACYDFGLYNSCLFMLRKICEISELFESKGIESTIKTPKGDYFQLSDLIKAAVSEGLGNCQKLLGKTYQKLNYWQIPVFIASVSEQEKQI